MKSVAIVGGGVSGLVAAWHLATTAPSWKITVFEADERVGGKLRREEIAGHRVDVGAESALWRRPEVVDLLAELGVEAVHPQRFPALLWSRGSLEALPAGTLMGIPSDPESARGLLSDDEVARAADERPVEISVPRSEAGDNADDLADISVGDAVEQALGAAVVDRMVEPLLGGVYAGNARKLSARACVPPLFKALRDGRRLTEAARAASSAVSSNDTRQVFGAPTDGMGSLPEALRAGLADRGVDVVTGARVTELRRSLGHRGTWHLEVERDGLPEPHEADGVIVTTAAPAAARLLAAIAPEASDALGGIEYATMAIVTYAFPASVHASLPEGTGFLVPPVDGRTIKASTFSSVKWPWLAEAASDVAYVRVSMGRHRDEAVLDHADDELLALGLDDLGEATGLDLPAPLDAHVQRWANGLPQYALGHVERVRRIRDDLTRLPALDVAGAALDGVGIPACVATARAAADRVLDDLAAQDALA